MPQKEGQASTSVFVGQTWTIGQWTKMNGILYKGATIDGIHIDILDIPAYHGAYQKETERRVCLVRNATSSEQVMWRTRLFYVHENPPEEWIPDKAPTRILRPIDLSKEFIYSDPLALAHFGLSLLNEYPDFLQKYGKCN